MGPGSGGGYGATITYKGKTRRDYIFWLLFLWWVPPPPHFPNPLLPPLLSVLRKKLFEFPTYRHVEEGVGGRRKGTFESWKLINKIYGGKYSFPWELILGKCKSCLKRITVFLSVPKWNRVWPIFNLRIGFLSYLDAASVVLRLCSVNKY